MSKNKVFVVTAISFLFGVFFGNALFDFELIFLFFLALITLFSLLLLIVRKYHFFIIIIVLGAFFGLMYSSINNYLIVRNLSKIEGYYFKDATIVGEVIELYKRHSDYNAYILKLILLNWEENFNFNFLLYVNPNIVLSRGQMVRFKSRANKINNFSDNFNNVRYMQSKGVYFFVFKPRAIEFLYKRQLPTIEKYIFDFRQKVLGVIYEIYPKIQASFLSGLLIGSKENLDEEILKNFNNSGLTHIISISGFNITIMIMFLGFLFKFFPLFIRTVVISIFVVFFILLVGSTVPVVRAGIMGLLGYYTLVLGRNKDSLTLLLLTAFLMTLYNPLYLNYDVSFRLSFLAVLGILYFQDFWSRVFVQIPNFLAIKESFILTMSALTTTLPIMIFNFGKVLLLAPISNAIVGGLVPFAMLFGFLSVMGQVISEKLGFLIGFVNSYILEFILFTANFIGNLSFSVINLDFSLYSTYLEIIYFLILLFFLIYTKKETTKA